VGILLKGGLLMRLNISKEEINNNFKKEEDKLTKYLYYGAGVGFISGLLFGNSFFSILGMTLTGFLTALILPGVLKGPQPPSTPFYLYDYFEEIKEKVLSSENIGSVKQDGRVTYYDASNFYKVDTDKNSYLVEIENEQVISCVEHNKNVPVQIN
jgi:hypothetical protein